MEKIYIKNENNYYQYFETLKRNRAKRHAAGEFFVEGVKSVNEAFRPENGWEVSALIYPDETELSGWAADTVKKYSSGGGKKKLFIIKKELLLKLSGKEDENSPSEIIITVKTKPGDIRGLKLNGGSSVLIFERPTNKGNLGAIIRSCDSFGIGALILTGHGVDLYDCETIRASMGSFFRQKIITEPSFRAIAEWARAQKSLFGGLQIHGTSADTSESKPLKILDHMTFERGAPVIAVIGSEPTGMSGSFYGLCDAVIKIPMSERAAADSLNAACAASVLMYEIYKSRN